MNEYQKEKLNEAKRLQELCKQIAFYLNAWRSIAECGHTPYRLMPSKRIIQVRTFSTPRFPKQRLTFVLKRMAQVRAASLSMATITCGWPVGCSILMCVTMGRTDAKACPQLRAAQLKPRTLSPPTSSAGFCLKYMRLVQRGIERRNSYQKSTDDTLTALRALAKDTLSPERIGRLEDRIKERPDETKSFNLEHQRGEVSVSGRDVTLKIDVTMEQAKQILKLIS